MSNYLAKRFFFSTIWILVWVLFNFPITAFIPEGGWAYLFLALAVASFFYMFIFIFSLLRREHEWTDEQVHAKMSTIRVVFKGLKIALVVDLLSVLLLNNFLKDADPAESTSITLLWIASTFVLVSATVGVWLILRFTKND